MALCAGLLLAAGGCAGGGEPRKEETAASAAETQPGDSLATSTPVVVEAGGESASATGGTAAADPAASPSASPAPSPAADPGASASSGAAPVVPGGSPDGRSGAQLDTPFAIKGIPIVSKRHHVSANYVPPTTDDYRPVDPVAAPSLKALLADAAAAGHMLTVNSGYRSYDTQAEIFYSEAAIYGEEEANLTTARPGESEHQTGLAVDFTDDDNEWASFSTEFGSLASGIWLAENAHRYGFILRYPEGRESVTGYTYEPWHFRYVGKAVAMAIGPNPSVTLEEYLGDLP